MTPRKLQEGLEESALAAMLGLPLEDLQKLLAGIKPLRRAGAKRWFDWQKIRSRLSDDILSVVRQQIAERRALIRPSKRWVSGYPELVAQWDWRRNVNLIPDDVSFGSHKSIWWRCDKGPDHQWEARAQSRTGGVGCPFCAGQRVSVTNSLATREPGIAVQWHQTKNGALTPEGFVWSSNRGAWWECPEGPDHEWRARINNRTSNDAGCPYCSGAEPSVTNCVATLFPELAEEWHPTRNGRLMPDKVTTGSNREVWWRCRADAAHEWRTSIENRTRGSRCPFCSGNRLTPDNSLLARHPEVASQWHPTANGGLDPSSVSWSSNEIAWWKCPHGADHEWRARINNRTSGGSGCPYCTGRRSSAGTSLLDVFPEVAEEWHPTLNGRLTPEMVTTGSHRVVWWRCRRNGKHRWRARIRHRVVGTGCPHCTPSVRGASNS